MRLVYSVSVIFLVAYEIDGKMLWADTKHIFLLQLYKQNKLRQVVCNKSVDLEYVELKSHTCSNKTFKSSVQLLKSPTVKLFESSAVTFH